MYRLHTAPDTAALIVRLALEELGQPYEAVPIRRAEGALDSAAYRRLNPTGLIPVLETPDGPIFETAAILLWLGERHGALAPAPGNASRAEFLKWLFFLSNTLHADLIRLFHPERYIGPDPALQAGLAACHAVRVNRHLALLDALGMAERPAWLSGTQPSVLGYYLAVLLRWSAMTPAGPAPWFELAAFPYLQGLAERLERRPAAQRATSADGLGPTPFSAPSAAAVAKAG